MKWSSTAAAGVTKFRVKVIVPPSDPVCVAEGVILTKDAPGGPPETYAQVQLPGLTPIWLVGTEVPLMGDAAVGSVNAYCTAPVQAAPSSLASTLIVHEPGQVKPKAPSVTTKIKKIDPIWKNFLLTFTSLVNSLVIKKLRLVYATSFLLHNTSDK